MLSPPPPPVDTARLREMLGEVAVCSPKDGETLNLTRSYALFAAKERARGALLSAAPALLDELELLRARQSNETYAELINKAMKIEAENVALRRHCSVLHDTVRGEYLCERGDLVRCTLCIGEWRKGEPEQHEDDDCLAAPEALDLFCGVP